MAVFLLLIMLIQESIFFMNANECMTRAEVLALVLSMEQKYEAAISSLKAEHDIDISLLKAEVNDLKRNQMNFGHKRESVNNIKETPIEMNPESHLAGSDKQANIGGKVQIKSNPFVSPDVIGRTYQTKRYLLGDGVQESGVAFTATINASSIDHLGQGQTIHFGNIISNLGNAFDASLSVFHVPANGWYVFSLTLMSQPNQTQQLHVVKNNVHVFHCFSQGNEYNTASRTVVLHADQGDEIWVQTTTYGYSTHVHGGEHTSFTGFLLYVDQ